MDYNLTRSVLGAFFWLAAAIAAAQDRSAYLGPVTATSANGPTSITDGAALMEDVLQSIEQHVTVSAKVRYRANLFQQQLVGSGVYLQRQSDQGTQVHLALSVNLGERLVSLLQVSDGRFLYTRDNLDDRLKLGRVDLQRLKRVDAGAEATGVPMTLTGGGVPQLLRSLATNFNFSSPQPVLFQNVPVWTIACTWKADRLAEVCPAAVVDASGQVVADHLPEYFPDRVFVLLGQDDLFPYRIDYRRSKPNDGFGRWAGDSTLSQSITTMELFEVQFDAPLDPLLFAYKPGNDERLEDRTDDYLANQRRPAAVTDASKSEKRVR